MVRVCIEIGCSRTDMAARGLCTACYKRKRYQSAQPVVRNLTCFSCDSSFTQTGPGTDRTYCSRKCKRAANEPPKCAVVYGDCAQCGKPFAANLPRAYCDDVCRRDAVIAAYRARRACPDCGSALAKDEHRCTTCAAVHNAATDRKNRRAAHAIRRARVRSSTVERFDPIEVFERDGWVCALCSLPVARELKVPHPDAPTLDHVKALALGGEHSRANAQLAHFLCNSRKGARELAAVSNG